MTTALRELLAIFDIKVDDHELKEGHKAVEGFTHTLKEVAKTVGEAFAVKEIYEFVEANVEAAAHVQDLSERLDLSATTISAWGFIMKGAGVDADSSARSLGFLEKNLGEAILKGGQAAAPFQLLGVRLKDAHGAARPLIEVLGDVSEGLQKLPDQNQRASVAMEIFGREGRALLPVLMKGKEALAEMFGEAGELSNGLGDGFYLNAKKAREESEKLGRAWQSMKDRSLAVLLPYVTSFLGLLKEGAKWSLEHAKETQVLEWAMGGLAAVAGVALVDALGSAAAMAWAFMAPFAPLTLAVGGAVWVVQDLYTLLSEGDSVLGRFAERLGGVGAKTALIRVLGEAWADLKGEIDVAAFGLGYFLGIFAGVGKALKDSWMVAAIAMMFEELGIKIGDTNDKTTLLVGTFRALKDVLVTVLQLLPGVEALRLLGAAAGALHGGGPTLPTNANEYGVPKDIVQDVQPGPWRDPSQHVRPRQPETFFRDDPRMNLLEPRAPHVGGSIAAPEVFAAPHVGGLTVQQHFGPTTVSVQTKSDKPREVGDAVGAGVANAHQKNMNNALNSVVRK